MLKDNESLNILVVEDNPGDYLLIKDYLEEQINIIDITHASRFQEADAILSNRLNKFDAILLDLTLPDKTGEELITEIISKSNEAPVIVLTGFANVDFGIRSLALKVSDYLLKDDITASSLYKSIKYNIERKKTSLRLEESEKKYSNLFQLSPQPMWIFDIETLEIIQVNKAAVLSYGYPESEFTRMRLTDLLKDEDSESEREKIIKEIIQHNEVYKGRYKHRKKSGEIIEADIYSNVITINDKKYESVIAIDVTEKILFEHKITKAIIKTQEDERYEIGTELHDNVCQILASSQLSLEMLKDNISPESLQWFNKSKELITLALQEIRNISHRLAPAFFDRTGLEEAFSDLLEDFNVNNHYQTHLNINFGSESIKLSSDIQLNLYRMLQEQLRNISKYARAKVIDIDIIILKNNLIFSIADNGVGFEHSITKKGIGLANIKRRAELFSGRMDIETAPGEGCKVIVTIPLKK